ncbi:hypothetical protein [Mucilaginibacter paludis]|uniref:Uncharacterized protein n=1 Tax=Mucilaginibacter paludis DSM 18603 TaxID=714943 RepID=H1YDE3_9SPHI|nr:hypothetical protein [Mucilaginibacter paludis]EHQ30152.1 hypothetical protein Mucpa_6094 [Mucilaginibacter paludis DSM 18603]
MPNIKKLFVLLFAMICQYHVTLGQVAKYHKVSNEALVYVLNNLTLIAKYKTPDNYQTSGPDLFISVFDVSDPSGSAGNESCEVTTTIYIAVSEDGEAPEQHVYKLTSLYNPKFVKWMQKPGGPAMLLSYGSSDGKRKAIEVKIALQGLTIISK